MSKQPDPWPTLSARLSKIEAQLARLASASAFYGTGMHPNGLGGLDSDTFDPTHGFSLRGDTGAAEFNGNVEVGGTMDVGGTLHVTGNTVIGGTLSLPAGIIDNDALTSPVLPGRLHADAQNFGAGPTWSTIASVSATIPSGYTQALVLNMTAGAGAFNSTTAVDFLYIRGLATGATLGGWQISSPNVPGETFGTAFNFRTGLLTGLTPGGTLTFTAEVSTAFGSWAADMSNVANLDVGLLWVR